MVRVQLLCAAVTHVLPGEFKTVAGSAEAEVGKWNDDSYYSFKETDMTKVTLVIGCCLCSLSSLAQPTSLHYSQETWNGYPPVVSQVVGKIHINQEAKSIDIHSRYREETYKIIRGILEEDSLAVYSCETRFPNGQLIRYVIKYDAAQHVFVLYPDNPYLKASTTFRLDSP